MQSIEHADAQTAAEYIVREGGTNLTFVIKPTGPGPVVRYGACAIIPCHPHF